MFEALINRSRGATEWRKIPWDDPEFSARMLREHLSQDHDAASRREAIIDRHVAWIQQTFLQGQPVRILDLGCGPGFYARRLAALGHHCTCIDFSPASIDYARQHDAASEYRLGDLRTVNFGSGYDLALLIYGELNAFSADEARQIVAKAHAALRPGGTLVCEVHPYAVVERVGQEAPSWFTARAGLFSPRPHLCLMESSFVDERAVTQYYIIDAQDGRLTQYTTMLQAYTEDAYRALFADFAAVDFFPSLTGDAVTEDLFVIVARRAG